MATPTSTMSWKGSSAALPLRGPSTYVASWSYLQQQQQAAAAGSKRTLSSKE
jgi:hypothetical protein